METNHHRNKLTIFSILLGGLAFVTIAILSKPEPLIKPEPVIQPPFVKVMVAQVVEKRNIVEAQGVVQTKQHIELSARVAGTVAAVHSNFFVGESFNKGDLLLEIDGIEYHNQVSQMESNLAQAEERLAIEKGQMRQAENQWRDLGDKEANDLFLRKPQINRAYAAVKYAKSNLEVARVNLSRTKVKAPFDGRIAKIKVNVGQFVAANTPIAEFYSLKKMQVVVPLTLKELNLLSIEDGLLNEKQQVILKRVISTQTTMLDREYRSDEWVGYLINIDANINIASRTYNGVIEVENNQKTLLLAGMFVSAFINSTKIKKQVKIPAKALVEGMYVHIVNQKNLLQERNVIILSIDEQWASVAGINTGELIVVEKPLWVQEGSEVKIKKQHNQ